MELCCFTACELGPRFPVCLLCKYWQVFTLCGCVRSTCTCCIYQDENARYLYACVCVCECTYLCLCAYLCVRAHICVSSHIFFLTYTLCENVRFKTSIQEEPVPDKISFQQIIREAIHARVLHRLEGRQLDQDRKFNKPMPNY